MPRISDGDLARLKENVSLAELCRSRGIELKPHGRRDLVGLCPFHEDKNPSFVVSPGKNLFHCLGCDVAGSPIDFVMKADGLDFRTAVDRLLPGLRGAAVAAPPRRTPAQPAATLAPEKANRLLERVVELYAHGFAELPDGRAYLERRGIADAGILNRHRAGYAAGRLKDLLARGESASAFRHRWALRTPAG